MLLLRGKFQDASQICHKLGLSKWAFLLLVSFGGREVNRPLLTKHVIENTQPSIDIVQELQEIFEIFPSQKLAENGHDLLAFILYIGQEKAELEGLLFHGHFQSRHLLRWALLIIKALDLHNSGTPLSLRPIL